MDDFRLSLDGDSLDNSKGESELEKLRNEVKQKQIVLNEKSEIITSLRQQVSDLKEEIEELENSQQLSNQREDRLKKLVDEKTEELEAVSHALKEVETANENLNKRLESRTNQLQKFVEDLAATKKKLEEANELNERLLHEKEKLTVELDLASSRKDKNLRERSIEAEEALHREQLTKLKQELELTESSWRTEKHHKDRYARENLQLERKVTGLSEQIKQMREMYSALESKCVSLELKLEEDRIASPPPRLAAKSHAQQHDENRHEFTSAIHFPIADEVGEIMDSSSALIKEKRSLNDSLYDQQYSFHQSKRTALNERNPNGLRDTSVSYNTPNILTTPGTITKVSSNNYCANHRIQKSQFFEDPIAEQKKRIERANELARRNMKVKPLHQTSYPLELDTFTNDLTEQEIKHGNVHEKRETRQAVNQVPRVRQPVKKAEAFIV